MKVTKQEADKMRAARGFSSMKEWAKENRHWARNHRNRKAQKAPGDTKEQTKARIESRADMADRLDEEYDNIILPNL